MKNLWKFSLIALAMSGLVSCEKEETKNMEPSVPTTLSPAHEAVNVAKKVTLNWKTSIDPEKTMVKYTLFVGINTKLVDTDIKGKDLAETKYEVDLNGHTTYFWKVVAKDAEGLTAESAIFSFTTDNSTPAKSVGSFPAHEAVGVAKTVAFAWSAATDEDGDAIKYDLYVSESNTFADADKKASQIAETTFDIQNLKAHTQYFWKVVAVDAQSVKADSDVYSFTTVNALPTKSEVTEVVESLDDKNIKLLIKWNASTDADGDAVTYDLYLSADATFEAADKVASDLTVLEYTKENTSGYTNYSIKVVSKDGVAEVSTETKMHKTQMLAGEIYLEKGKFTDSRDKHEYKTVTINGTTWMAENLAYLPYLVSTEDPFKKASVIGASDATDVAKAKAHENYTKYGVVYSWDMLADIAPDGWHVATEEEWQALEKLAGVSADDLERKRAYRNTAVAAMFKSKEDWPTPGANALGLNIKMGGTSKFSFFGGSADYKADSRAYYWTSSLQSTGSQFAYMRAFTEGKVGVYRNSEAKNNRNYVRLVKD